MTDSPRFLTFQNVRLVSLAGLYDVVCDPSSGLILSVAPAAPATADDAARVQELLDQPDHIPLLLPDCRLETTPDGDTVIHGEGSLLVPSLSHPHIHLDKAYLLGEHSCVPGSKDACGVIDKGDFPEALSKTFEAKKHFTRDDLTRRASAALAHSLSAGVTSVTTHCEVDPSMSPPTLSISVALELQKGWARRLELRPIVFAQEPCFNAHDGEECRRLIEQACAMQGVRGVGSAPYVEKAEEGEASEEDPTGGKGARNVEWIFELSDKHDLDVDFHIDYDLDSKRHPLIWTVLAEARSRPAFHLPSSSSSKHLPSSSSSSDPSTKPSPKPRSLTLGHATHLALFTPDQLSLLTTKCAGLRVTFVGLPPSDCYMAARDAPWGERPRGGFDLWALHDRGLDVRLGVNNLSNLFTPSSNPDPLSLTALSLPLFQRASPSALLSLLSMVSSSASPRPRPPPSASSSSSPLTLRAGGPASLLLVHGARSALELVQPSAERGGRTVVHRGRVVARRTAAGWVADEESA